MRRATERRRHCSNKENLVERPPMSSKISSPLLASTFWRLTLLRVIEATKTFSTPKKFKKCKLALITNSRVTSLANFFYLKATASRRSFFLLLLLLRLLFPLAFNRLHVLLNLLRCKHLSKRQSIKNQVAGKLNAYYGIILRLSQHLSLPMGF